MNAIQNYLDTMNQNYSSWPMTLACLSVVVLGACADRPLRTPAVSSLVQAELAPAPAPKLVLVPERITDALAEPAPMPVVALPEPRLDLLVNNAQAREVFLAIVADSRYSMLLHPDVSGTMSVTLRGVTVPEALEAIRDVYGFDFKIEGRRITVAAPSLQTRIFTINYPNSQRRGSSDLRVASGGTTTGGGVPGANGTTGSAVAGASSTEQLENSRVTTKSATNLWGELTDAVRALVGGGPGRNVVVSPQAGIIVVRAMPEELRQVEKFLKAAQVAVERQVMLEAKIVEVELSDGYQSGVNWSALASAGHSALAIGVLGSGVASTNPLLQSGVAIPGVVAIPSVQAGGGLFGLALSTTRFAAVLGFLETQGDVQTLSSPRIATLNNQKAVLKVGSDDYFVTNVSGGSTTAATAGTTASTTLPTLTLTSFFSGIALDVTPQIDDGNTIMLHVHPAITAVTEKTKQIDLGSIGNYRLPLASSTVNESDTMVRVQDGSIVAIGGLMQLESSRNASGLPGSTGAGFLSSLLGNRANIGRKKEVVVLIKPTIIRSLQDWEQQNRMVRSALEDMEVVRSRVVRLDGTVETRKQKTVPQ